MASLMAVFAAPGSTIHFSRFTEPKDGFIKSGIS
jgi:hypothetical protein